MQSRTCAPFAQLATRLLSAAPVAFLFCALQVGAAAPRTAASDAPVSAASNQLTSHTAPQVLDGAAARIGHYDTTKTLRLTLAIQPPHLAQEEQFLKELHTKGSPNFHKFLTADQWNTRFAPTPADEQKVVDWAQSQGLSVTARFPNRLLVNVEAPAGKIEQAFGVTINNYQLAGEVSFANDRDPVLPESLSGIVYSVQGLNNIQREHGASPNSARIKVPDYAPGPVKASGLSDHKDAAQGKQALAAAAKNGAVPNLTGGALDPSDIYSSQAYNYAGLQTLGHCCNPNNNPAGSPPESSIAIAAFGPILGGDIALFGATYPNLAFHYNVYYINGAFTCPSGQSSCPSAETTQDLEWAIATSNSFDTYKDTAHIYVYVGATEDNGTFTTMYNQMLSDGFARVFTTSWSCTEIYSCSTSTMDARHAIFDAMVGQGWTLVAASGDRGSADDCSFDDPANLSVSYPASDPDFVAAGGTELQLDANGNWNSEDAWSGGTSAGSCAGNNGGSGGGASAYFDQPSWQSSFGDLGSNRLVPDLALNAAGIGQNMFFNGSLIPAAGGTSVVAPELAGFFAQENAYLLAIGKKCGSGSNAACAPIGNPAPFIYASGAANGFAHNPFYDITSGCNSNDVTLADGIPSYCARSGYDLVTGWGSANMMQLAWELNGQVVQAQGAPTVNFTGPAANGWYSGNQAVNWTIVDSSPGSGIAGYTGAWDSIPPDASSEPNGGSGNSFYSGPAVPNDATGCLSLQGGACGSGVADGCHTVHVEGWNNQGATTGDTTYGPLCLDSVPPAVTASNNPAPNAQGWYQVPVTVTLTSTDSGGSASSGLANTYFATSTQCTASSLANCSTYSNPPTLSAEGVYNLVYFAQDNAGNFSPVGKDKIQIDQTPPNTTTSLSGTQVNGIYSSAVKITFHATDSLSGVLHTYYVLDSASSSSYNATSSSPVSITVSTLGSHTLNYWSVDNAGNTESTNSQTFTISSPTTTALTASPNPTPAGQKVTLTAAVSATLSGTPTGSVTFFNGSSKLGSATLSSGVATLSTTTLPTGQLNLQASYAGATNFLSSSGAFTESIGSPAVKLSATSLTFPQTQAGASSALSVTVTNTGTINLTLSGITASGTNPSDFAPSKSCVGIAIAPGSSCAIQVTFTPAGSSTYTATLKIADNASTSPQSVTLTGKGITLPSVTLSTTAPSFPQTYVGSTSTLPITVTNTGAAPLKITAIANHGTNPSDFSHASTCIGTTIAVHASCTLQLKFTPASAAGFSATVSLTDNAANSPQTITVSGTGINRPTVKLSATTLSFPSTKVGSTSSLPLKVTNSGKGTLLITSIVNSGSHPTYFVDSSSCVGVSIAPAGTCAMQVTFKPGAKGSFTGTMKLTDNATSSPQSVALKGTGK